ncbi:MAG: PrsW family intramembrane metalloprotease [Clostridia bacterium]|nr:PrsW family intramembrane metalloprotease [Clostridia bacterium]
MRASKKGKGAISEFFKQTFRRHTGGEYSELLTRGLRSDAGGLNKKYPWAYIRLFSLMFVLFAVFLLIVRFTSNELFVPTITVLASVCFNLSFILFLFELYPKRDLSFMSVCLAMLLGGALANVATQILFNIFPPPNAWLKAVYSGFFEELPKAISVVLVIVISRKNSPLVGFMFGAAVGCGFSIVEDMGYIFLQANEMPYMNLTTIIEVSLARGFSALCTHTLWTAAVGWAYCHYTRHWANVMFYLVTLLSCGLHIAWDLPLGTVALGFIYAGCTAVIFAVCILILYSERKKVYKQNVLQLEVLYKNENAVSEMWEHAEQERQVEKALDKSNPLYWRHWGNFTVVLGAVLMSIVGVIYCSIPFRETYGTERFSNAESFVEFMQNEVVFNVEENRAYNSHDTALDVPVTVGGELVRVTQRVIDKDNADITYNYKYSASYDDISNKHYYFLYSTTVTTKNEDGLTVEYEQENVYNDGKLYASFFRLNNSVTGYNFTSNGDITVFVYNPAFERDLRDWRYLSLFVTFASIFGVATVCNIGLLIKSWRVKKLCLTTDASSAE